MDNSFLPLRDKNFLNGKGFSYREVNDGAQRGIIIDNFPVYPQGKFTADTVSLLILLPIGYPDIAPDMFYTIPTLRFTQTNTLPAQADYMFSSFGTIWQRWSRHSTPDAWRPGIDGLQSYLQRVLTALNAA